MAVPMASSRAVAAVEEALAECKTNLEAFEKKERFLQLRLGKYRTLMDRREARITDLRNRLPL